MRRSLALLALGIFFTAPRLAEAATPVRVVVLSLERASSLDVDERLKGQLGEDVRKSLANSPFKRARVLKDARLRLDDGQSADVPIQLTKGKTKLTVQLVQSGAEKTKLRFSCPGIDNLNTVTSHANGGTLLLVAARKGRAIAIVPGRRP